jgi:hypothetical protein
VAIIPVGAVGISVNVFIIPEGIETVPELISFTAYVVKL